MGYELRVFFKRLDDGSELDLIETVNRKFKEQVGESGKKTRKPTKEPTRTDTYINFGEHSVGLKLRHGKELELKLRFDNQGHATPSSSHTEDVDEKSSGNSGSVANIPKVEYWKKRPKQRVPAPISAANVLKAYFPASSVHAGQNRVRELLQKHATTSNDDIFISDAFPAVVVVKDRIQLPIPFDWYSKIYQGKAIAEQTDLQVRVKSSSSTTTSSSAASTSEHYRTELWRSIAIEGESEASLRSMWMYLFPDATQNASIFDGGYPEFADYFLSHSKDTPT